MDSSIAYQECEKFSGFFGRLMPKLMALYHIHARIQKVFSEGVSTIFRDFLSFFSSLGEKGYNYHNKWAIIGPPAKRH